MYLYYVSIVLQVICVYHIYKNHKEYYWFYVVIFLPYVGCIVYVFTQMLNHSTVSGAQEGAFKVLYPGKRIKDLENKLAFSDTFENRVSLGDAYLQNQRYEEAVTLYLSALKGHYENDYYVISNLIAAYYQLAQYQQVLEYTQKIKDKMEFRFSKAQFIYAKALEQTGQLDKAEEELRKTDTPYKNYEERYYLARFLADRNKKEEAKEITSEILNEAHHMQRANRRQYSHIFQLVLKLNNELQ